MTPEPHRDPSDSPDLPPDDRVIGRVFWRSIAVVALAGLGVATWKFWPRALPAPAPVAPLPAGPAPLATGALAPPIPFIEVAARAGIDFARTNGADGRKLLPETMGGGLAIVDVNGDGAPDLLLVDGDAWPDAPAGSARGQGVAVYLNAGVGDAATAPGATPHFQRAQATGLEAPRQAMGIAAADLNGDGRPELLLTGVDGVRLFVADPTSPGASPRWHDATEAAGLAGDHGWSTAAGFADLDRDGLLDLVVAHYIEWSPEIDERVHFTLTGLGRAYGPPTGFAGADVRLYMQTAPMHFEDQTQARGLIVKHPATGAPMGKALGLVFDDLDGDGALEIAVANDTVQNFLFKNDGTGHFTECGVASGFAFDRNGAATGAMGLDVARYRDDATIALAVGNFANEPTSFYATADGKRFSDDAIVEGLSAPSRRPLKFGVLFADLDGDGREDLVQANGHIEPSIEQVQPTQRYAQSAQVFWNTGFPEQARFTEVPADALGDLSTPVVGRGLAWGDLDGDGALDLVIAPVTGAPRVLLNRAPHAAHLQVELVDPQSLGNRQAIGAKVTLGLRDGSQRTRTIMPTRSYLSQVPPEAWFALGRSGADTPQRIEVRWPDGRREEFIPSAGRARLTLQRGDGTALDPPIGVPISGVEPEPSPEK